MIRCLIITYCAYVATIAFHSTCYAEVKEDAKTTMYPLEGTWLATSIERLGGDKAPKKITDGMSLKFQGDKLFMTVVFPVKKTIECTYKIDENKKPKYFQFSPISVKPIKKKNFKGIFERTGNTLKICGVQDDREPRPKEFKTKPKSSLTLMVFKLKTD